MVTLPLDLDDLIAQAPAQPSSAIAPDTSVGHIHLKVADVPRAVAFYRDALGFEQQAQLPSAAFLSAGGYHHHVGLNSWQSHGASAPAASAPGLRNVGFALGGADELQALRNRLAAATIGVVASSAVDDRDDRLSVSDPDGQLLTFSVG